MAPDTNPMETAMQQQESQPEKTVLSCAAHSAQVIRSAVKRELECEMLGLIMAARMHGFRLELHDAGPVVIDQRAR